LARIAGWLKQQASELIYVNLTPSDMQALGFYTVRAILPQFQPIDFGWAERRLGGSRLYDYPMKAGLRLARAALADLNPDPHPLA
jgi:ribosomal protein S12 methylthiotransferase accessory factor